MKNDIFKIIENYQEVSKKIDSISNEIGAYTANQQKLSYPSSYGNDYSSPLSKNKPLTYGWSEGKSIADYEKELKNAEEIKLEISENIIKESTKYMLSFLYSKENQLQLYYVFPLNKEKIITVNFTSSFKNSNELNCSTIGRMSTNMNSTRGTVNLFELIKTPEAKKRVFHFSTSKEHSLTDFLKIVAKDYIENIETYIEEYNLDKFKNEKVINDIRTQFSWLHSKIYDSLLHLNLENSERSLKPFNLYNFDKGIIEDLIEYGVQKDKERLFYVLENNLSLEASKTKPTKI